MTANFNQTVLLLRLAGPMQSWGVQSRFSHRETGLEPSKSGVIGLLCCALGWAREEKWCGRLNGRTDIEGFARSLTMAVRVDREGRIRRDYHTAGGEHRQGSVLGRDAKGRPIPYGVAKADGSRPGTVVSERFYLADADFLIGLAGTRELLEQLDDALWNPVWPLFLGRKSFVPGLPVAVGSAPREGLIEGELVEVLQNHPLRRTLSAWRDNPPEKLRLVVETTFGEGDEVRPDQPLSFDPRSFGLRHVRTKLIPCPPIEEDSI